jgi:hypothetical protein
MRHASFVVLVLCGTLPLGSSAAAAKALMAGIKGGANLANLTGEDVFHNSTSPGGIGGVFARYGLSDTWSLQPEVLYSMRGAEFSTEGIENEQQFSYLEIPVLARAAWRQEQTLRPSLFAGPSLGILLENKIVEGAELDITDESNGIDVGVIVGGGLDYALGAGALLFDVRYERGVTSWSEDLDSKHSVVSFMIGYGYTR